MDTYGCVEDYNGKFKVIILDDQMVFNDPMIDKCQLIIFKTHKSLAKKYVWLENLADTDTGRRNFELVQSISSDDFNLFPMRPDGVESRFTIRTPADIQKLIRNDYEVLAFNHPKEYRRELAVYFTFWKEMYAFKDKSADEIWNHVMNEDTKRFTFDDWEHDVLKKLREVSNPTGQI